MSCIYFSENMDLHLCSEASFFDRLKAFNTFPFLMEDETWTVVETHKAEYLLNTLISLSSSSPNVSRHNLISIKNFPWIRMVVPNLKC